MKKFKDLTLIETAIDLFIFVLGIIAIVISSYYLHKLDTGLVGLGTFIDGIDPDSVVAGYEVIGGLFGYFGAGIFGLVLMVLLFLSVGISVLMIIPVISGFICLRKYKNAYSVFEMIKPVKVDTIIKIVINGFICLMIIYSSFDVKTFDMSMIGLLVLPGLVTGLSIYQLKELNDLKKYE